MYAWRLAALGGSLTYQLIPAPPVEAAYFAFDMVGRAQGAEATLAGLKSLRRWAVAEGRNLNQTRGQPVRSNRRFAHADPKTNVTPKGSNP